LGKKSRQECANACLETGFASLKKGDYDEAISRFDRASEHDPSNALIFVRRAGARFRQGKYADAVKDLTTALNIAKNDADYVTRGLAYRQMGELDKAMADFSDAISLNPKNAAAFAHRGEAYLAEYDDTSAKADLDRAIADLTQAVEICRKSDDADFRLADALHFRAYGYLLAKDYDRAGGDFAELVRIAPETKNLHVELDELAARFAEAGKFREAAQWETEAIKLAPDPDTKAEYGSRLKQYQTGKP